MNVPMMNMKTDSPDFWKDPYAYLEEARQSNPWIARFQQGYIVYGFDEMVKLLTDEENLRIGYGMIIDFYGVRGTMWARFMDEMMLAVSGDVHRQLRNSVSRAFTPRRANRERETMRRVVGQLLDKWAPLGSFDFAEFAAHFPISVMCALLGVSTDELPEILSALENHTRSLTFDPAAKPYFMAGWDVLWAFADRTVKAREKSGLGDPDSLLDTLIETKNSGELDETNLRFMLILLLIAGYDTSKNQLTVTMNLLLDRPEMYARCAEDLQFCRAVTEESLRHSSVVSNYRFALRDFTYNGVQFREGDTLVMALPLGDRDPSIFDDPGEFRPGREKVNHHLAFGRGAHICLGQFLARNQLQEGLHLIAQRLKNPARAGRVEWRPFLGVGGIKSLPVKFSDARAPDAVS